jgi:septum site-determining protein MinD
MLDTADILEILAVDLIGMIPEDESVLISTNRGNPAALDPKSKAGQAFRDIAKRLMGEEVPFPPLDGSESLRQRLSRLIHPKGAS